MKDLTVKKVVAQITATIVHITPLLFLCYSMYMAWLLGGISKEALGLSDESAFLNKSIASASMLCLFASGFARAKYKLDGLIDKEEAKNLRLMYLFTFIVIAWTLYQFSVSCGWLINFKIGKFNLNIVPAKQYNLVGFNKQMVIFALIVVPFLEFIAGAMSLAHLVEVYPELKGKKQSENKSAEDQFNDIIADFSDLKTQFSSIGTLNHTNKHEAKAIKSQLEQLKNKIINVKGLPDSSPSLKQQCTRATTDISGLISSIDSQISSIPN